MKTGIITGTGKGIGLSTVKLLLEKNYKIISLTKSENSNLNTIIRNNKKNFINFYIDLSNINETRKLAKYIFSKYKIDFLINNAGIRSRYSSEKLSDKIYKEVFDTNYFSPMALTEEYVKYIKKIKNKKEMLSIVSLTSIVGPRGFNELSSYAASKGALEYGMRSLAIELAKYNVRINCVAPGFTKTSYFSNFKKNKNKLYNWTLNQIPMKRWGEPSEIANTIEFLISDKSSYITGNVIYVDGGWVSK